MSKPKYSFMQRIRWLQHLIKSRLGKKDEDVAIDMIEKLPTTAPIVFDIGANVGLYIKAFNKSQNKPGAVLAFEPSSYVYSILKLTLARFKNVTCYQLAFDSKNGQATLNTPLKKSGSMRIGIAHIGNTFTGDYQKEVVETRTLDSFVKEIGQERIDLIKIDVEGAEFAILQGAKTILKKIRPFWYVEISEASGRFDNNSKQDTFDIFIKANYHAFYFNEEKKWQRTKELVDAPDFLFVPKEDVPEFLNKAS